MLFQDSAPSRRDENHPGQSNRVPNCRIRFACFSHRAVKAEKRTNDFGKGGDVYAVPLLPLDETRGIDSLGRATSRSHSTARWNEQNRRDWSDISLLWRSLGGTGTR